MSSFADALHLSDDRTGTFTADWGQGRAAFGGILAAWMVAGMQREVPADRALRSILVNFVGPLSPGAFAVDTELLRSGRAMTQMAGRLRQGAVVATATAAFGGTRGTTLPWPGVARPAWPAPDVLPAMPYIEGVTPAFTQHFEYRWATGGIPFSGAALPHFGGWIRPRGAPTIDARTLLTLLDAWPAPILAMAHRVVPISTVTWLANVLIPLDTIPREGWWAFTADTVHSAEGYADMDAKLWAPDGRLAATSRQLVAEFSG